MVEFKTNKPRPTHWPVQMAHGYFITSIIIMSFTRMADLLSCVAAVVVTRGSVLWSTLHAAVRSVPVSVTKRTHLSQHPATGRPWV